MLYSQSIHQAAEYLNSQSRPNPFSGFKHYTLLDFASKGLDWKLVALHLKAVQMLGGVIVVDEDLLYAFRAGASSNPSEWGRFEMMTSSIYKQPYKSKANDSVLIYGCAGSCEGR